MHSILQDWVMELPLRMQGVLINASRSCDNAPKPITGGDATPERELTSYLRFLIFNPADVRELAYKGSYINPNQMPRDAWKPSMLGHLPQHWYSHIMHAYQVCAYEHKNIAVRDYCLDVYKRLVHNMHLEVEPHFDMRRRLTEDRIKAGTVVS
jgi:hypothetical protein